MEFQSLLHTNHINHTHGGFTMKIRTKADNIRFTEHIESAIDKAQQGIDSITYTSYPEMNKRTIEKLKKAIDMMEDALEACIFKP